MARAGRATRGSWIAFVFLAAVALAPNARAVDGVIEDFSGAGIRFPGGVTETTYQGNTLAGNGSPGIVGAVTDAGGNYCNPGGGGC
jgi:hypothetical protein